MNAPAWVPFVIAGLIIADMVVVSLAWRAGTVAALAQEGEDE